MKLRCDNMKMVLVDERELDVKVVDCAPDMVIDFLEELMPEMRCVGHVFRVIDGKEYLIYHDDEFLYHGRNFTGICGNSGELLMGSLLITIENDADDYEDDDPSMGLRDLTAEECESIIKAWHPISPELATEYARNVNPSLMFLMGSNALHYDV